MLPETSCQPVQYTVKWHLELSNLNLLILSSPWIQYHAIFSISQLHILHIWQMESILHNSFSLTLNHRVEKHGEETEPDGHVTWTRDLYIVYTSQQCSFFLNLTVVGNREIHQLYMTSQVSNITRKTTF